MTALAATGWALAAYILFSVFVSVLLGVRPGAEGDIVSGVACQALAYLLTLFLILRVHAPDSGVRDFVGMRPTTMPLYPLAVLVGLAVYAPADALYTAIEHRWPVVVKDPLPDLFWAASFPKRAAIALVMILVGPALEEMLNRGALFRPMLKVHPPWMVIGVTATLFALSHPVRQVWLPIFLLGLVLGFVRRASGSLVPSILVHATFNAVTFFEMAARPPGRPEFPPPPLWLVAGGVVLTVALLLCFQALGAREAARTARDFDER
jgi:membrane protease YdiL (CAAX protease family)